MTQAWCRKSEYDRQLTVCRRERIQALTDQPQQPAFLPGRACAFMSTVSGMYLQNNKQRVGVREEPMQCDSI